MLGLVFMLFGAVFAGSTGSMTARVYPNVPISIWRYPPAKTWRLGLLGSAGIVFGLFAAIDLRHDIGLWSYLVTCVVLISSYYAAGTTRQRSNTKR
jgi:hypothetical protein